MSENPSAYQFRFGDNLEVEHRTAQGDVLDRGEFVPCGTVEIPLYPLLYLYLYMSSKRPRNIHG
jgi:hypothetical protein